MRVVLDTNVLLSGIFFGGVPGKILDAWAEGKFEIYITPNILTEYASALDAYASKKAESLKDYWITALTEHAHHVVDPVNYPKVCRDSHDDKFLYCAVSVKADWLVTGDQDLKVLEGSYDFKIVSPRQFLTFLNE